MAGCVAYLGGGVEVERAGEEGQHVGRQVELGAQGRLLSHDTVWSQPRVNQL